MCEKKNTMEKQLEMVLQVLWEKSTKTFLNAKQRLQHVFFHGICFHVKPKIIQIRHDVLTQEKQQAGSNRKEFFSTML